MTNHPIWDKIKRGVFIIAELGKNFIQTEEHQPVEVYLANAKKLVDEAVAAGADAVKFQTHNVDDEILDIHVDSPHFPNWKKGRHAWVKRNQEATPVKEFWLPLKDYCHQKGIFFFSTPMSRGAAKILHERIGTDLWKIGSGDILDFVMLDYMRQTEKPIIVSSGMSTLEEVEKSVNFLRAKNSRVAMMHCVSKYPCPPEDLRLATIELYKEKFSGIPVGFSDHSIEVKPPVAAVALGATMLEKHFTLSRQLWGPDHKASLEPSEMLRLVKAVREIEQNVEKKKDFLASEFAKRSMGTKEKILQEGESVFRPLFRKALMAGRDIPAGAIITADVLYAMRPQGWAGGLASEYYEAVMAKKTRVAFKKYDPINFKDLF